MITFGKLRAGKKDPIKPPFDSLDFEKIMSGIQMLREMEESRNNLAHCVVRPNERLEVFTMGETVCYERKDVVSILTDMRKCLNFIAALRVCLSSSQSTRGA
jgi:hypothetical protein